MYSESFVNLSYINHESSDVYSDKQISVEELFSFDELNNDFMFGYATEILFDLYNKVFKEEYKRNDLDDVYIHCFLDGRDLPPKSAADIIDELQRSFPGLSFTRVSYCAGIITLHK